MLRISDLANRRRSRQRIKLLRMLSALRMRANRLARKTPSRSKSVRMITSVHVIEFFHESNRILSAALEAEYPSRNLLFSAVRLGLEFPLP